VSDSGLLAIYWKERRQSFEECTGAVFESLQSLQALGYEHYFQLGKSRKKALEQPFRVTPEDVRALLAKGVNHTDHPRKPIPELGWRLSLWSGGADDESYGISFHVGSYGPYVGNNVVFNLPRSGRFALGASTDPARKAFHALVRIWSPEEGVLCERSTFGRDKAGRITLSRAPLARIQPK
jgi:hypothetical protein